MEKNWELGKRPDMFHSWAFWKYIVALAIGGLAGLIYYFVEGRMLEASLVSKPLVSILGGALFGLFFMLSPCARGRC